MATLLFELISPERVLFSGDVRAVMLPATEGDMTVMPGHEPTIVMLNPGIVALTDAQGHGHRAFVRSGFVEITNSGVSVLAERVLPPEELTRDRLDEEILRFETMRDALRDEKARREAEFAISRLEQVKTTLSF
ncbi:ATP synthase F1 subunit epsilon [Microvirga lotononidis]|uniref:ATP synthase epsilon chain n=1 Tax=Microvirga lotononidis TaxID=864069 RepID=I4YZM9_9HYPH|nr:ATP synthase F1 subunit epsilon [Microvirga lotononidis]EIM29421.1 ATP synthase, F1 epsilon subunit [Microvirga lotononidis]WQO27258.1 ATP synthase F1 subunit epsilon [Microvirga lotononidis]